MLSADTARSSCFNLCHLEPQVTLSPPPTVDHPPHFGARIFAGDEELRSALCSHVSTPASIRTEAFCPLSRRKDRGRDLLSGGPGRQEAGRCPH